MTISGTEFSWTIGDYRFEVTYDSGSGCGLDERTIWWQRRIPRGWTEGVFLRSYYFEEVNRSAMRNFCQKFATDQPYRDACLGEATDWAVRNKLFERNIEALVTVPPLIARSHRAIGDEHQTWVFIKHHWQAIMAQPEYQQIAALDASFIPTMYELDPEIIPAVAAFNQVVGVETRFSCQGVTAIVIYGGYDILVISPHQRFAYIRFNRLPSDMADQLNRLTLEHGLAALHDLTLYSTGDNLAFRAEAVRLAGELQQARLRP